MAPKFRAVRGIISAHLRVIPATRGYKGASARLARTQEVAPRSRLQSARVIVTQSARGRNNPVLCKHASKPMLQPQAPHDATLYRQCDEKSPQPGRAKARRLARTQVVAQQIIALPATENVQGIIALTRALAW